VLEHPAHGGGDSVDRRQEALGDDGDAFDLHAADATDAAWRRRPTVVNGA
jgi:hypothetical protein